MKYTLACSLVASLTFFGTHAAANLNSNSVLTATDLHAQRNYSISNGRAVSMDFKKVELEMTFDPSANETHGRAVIEFLTLEQGLPYFLLDASIQSAKLDGSTVTIDSTQDEPGLNQIKMVSQEVSPGTQHSLEVEYLLSSENITYNTGGIGFITAMLDIDSGNFLEKYAPSNFEDDQYSMTATLNLINATTPHRLFTNGTVTSAANNTWRIEFPPYFNTSSFYIHLTNKDLVIQSGVYQGLEKEIPYTVYSSNQNDTQTAAAAVPVLLRELEGTYGPYYHKSFTAYISGTGGMEHSGATITEMYALGHELLHSWFARGVQPSNGNSGWIDEAIATWRDQNYPSTTPTERDPANLGGFSLFNRFTPFAAYPRGAQFMSDLEGMLAGHCGGLRSLLAEFFAQYKGKLITTSLFESWLTHRTRLELTAYFQRYVYGNGQPTGNAGAPGTVAGIPIPGTNHPPALTPSAIEDLR